MDEERSGGVNINDSKTQVNGDVVGGDKYVNSGVVILAILILGVVGIVGLITLGISVQSKPLSTSMVSEQTAIISTPQSSTSTKALTPIQTSIPAQQILFKDDFINNSNLWALQTPVPNAIPRFEKKIIGGKFINSLWCASNYCFTENEIPTSGILYKDFELEFDSRISQTTVSTDRIIIGIKLRHTNSSNFYFVYFDGEGAFGMSLIYNGQTETLRKYTRVSLQDMGKVTKYRIVAQNHIFRLFENDQEITQQIEDGNLLFGGRIFLATQIYTSSNSVENVVIEYDNLVISTLK